MEVASACISSGNTGGHQTAKRKFFQWAVKWFYANMAEDTLEKPDAPVLACLLQSIGFQLRGFEKIDESNSPSKFSRPNNETVRVFVECGTSGMRACLELNDVKCKCPNSDDTKDASFWSVTGTGPTATTTVESTNRIEESGSNLLPPISKETSKIIHDVTYHLLNMIIDKSTDINQNCKKDSNMNLSPMCDTNAKTCLGVVRNLKNTSMNIARSYTQPEIILPNSATGNRTQNNWSIRPLENTKSSAFHDLNKKKWSPDLECETIENDQPRPSPPKIASSPVFMNQLCSSLGQISLQSEEDTSNNVVEHVVRARKNLDKAIELLMAKKSPNSRNSSTHEQATFLKPTPGGLNLTAGGSRRLSSSSNNSSLRSPTGVPNSRPNSRCSLTARETTVPRVTRTSLAGQSKPSTASSSSSTITRRSVGSALLKLSSTIGSAASTNTESALKRNNTSIQHNTSASKIPGRRKSFGALGSQPLKLAAAAASRGGVAALKKNSPDPKIPPVTSNQSGIQKPNISLHQPQGNLKFGYAKKKSSNV